MCVAEGAAGAGVIHHVGVLIQHTVLYSKVSHNSPRRFRVDFVCWKHEACFPSNVPNHQIIPRLLFLPRKIGLSSRATVFVFPILFQRLILLHPHRFGSLEE